MCYSVALSFASGLPRRFSTCVWQNACINTVRHVMDMFINMRQFLAVLWTLGLLLHFYLLHEFFLLDYKTILSNLELYKLSFRKYNLSKN